MDINLIQLMEDGVTIITPTKRLSRHISYQFAQDNIKRKTSWVTPCCLPWESWCESIFSKLLFSEVKFVSEPEAIGILFLK